MIKTYVENKTLTFTNEDQKNVSLSGNHLSLPYITLTHDGASAAVNVFVSSLTKTSSGPLLTVGTSGDFTGNVYVHAMSFI